MSENADTAASPDQPWKPLTPSQEDALAVIDQHGAAYVSNRTWPSANMIDHRAVRALERLGLVEVFLGGDGRFARRAQHNDGT